MAELGKNLKGIWLKGMEAISNTASSIASNTKYKVDEMNIVNRRREILSDFGAQAYELWQKGERFPETLETLLEELSKLDEELNAIRTEKLAGVKTDEAETDEAEDQAEQEPSDDDAVPTLDVPAEDDAAEEPAISYVAAEEQEAPEEPVLPDEDQQED